MDKFPLCWNGKTLGELTTEKEPMYIRFDAKCCLPAEGLWCVWVVGECGELRLGVPEPGKQTACIRRRFSHRMAEPLGQILRGELRAVETGGQDGWSPLEDDVFRTQWLRRQLRELPASMTRTVAQRRYLAVPYSEKTPFPLPPLFCFAKVRRIKGEDYVVFSFDREEWPLWD